jgi:hypothetical protein
MSAKQIARTVIDGKLLTFRPFATAPDFTVCGYVYGMDDYHWAVVEPSGQTHLVHKGAPVVTLGLESTFTDEAQHEKLEQLVGPFRRYIERNDFGRDVPDPARDADERAQAAC